MDHVRTIKWRGSTRDFNATRSPGRRPRRQRPPCPRSTPNVAGFQDRSKGSCSRRSLCLSLEYGWWPQEQAEEIGPTVSGLDRYQPYAAGSKPVTRCDKQPRDLSARRHPCRVRRRRRTITPGRTRRIHHNILRSHEPFLNETEFIVWSI